MPSYYVYDHESGDMNEVLSYEDAKACALEYARTEIEILKVVARTVASIAEIEEAE